MKKSIKKNYLLNLLYQITLIIVPLIVTPYSARALQPEGIGQYSFCFSIISYFTLFATFGFDIYGQREIAKYQNNKEKQSEVFWEIFICKTITTCISLIILGVLLIFNIFGSSNSTLIMILSLNIIATGLDIVFYMQGNEDFGKSIFISICIKIIGAVSIFLFVKSTSDLWIYTLIHALMLAIGSISLWPIILKQLNKINISNLKPFQHLKKSFSLFVPAIATTIYCILDKTLIGLITNSNAQNGYYEQSEKIVKITMTLITCLSFVMIPRNTKEIAQGNHEQVKKNIYTACNFIWILGIPMVFGICLIAGNVIPWFLGEGYEYSILLLNIFSPLVLLIGVNNIFGQQFLVPYQKDKYYTIALITGAATNLILNLIFINLWGSLGATIATIIAEFVVTLVMYLFIHKELSSKEMFKTIFKPLIASILMFAIIYPLTLKLIPSIINTCIIVLAAIIVYFILILILKERLTLTFLKSFLSKIKNKLKKEKK